MSTLPTENIVEYLNALPGWLQTMGVRILGASSDEVRCEWDIDGRHLQGQGIVHGGVHCGVIESLASIGAALVARTRGQRVVGLENNTSFVRAVREGRLHGLAHPVTRGRTNQLWEAWIRNADGQIVAQGRVRLQCIDEARAVG